MKPDLKNKKTAAVAGSLAGILIVAAILILLNAILKPVNLRWDCTEGKRYTLSRGTGNILKNLDKPVSIRFYYSRNAADMPAFLKTYASRVEDLLGEFQRAGGKRVELKKLNPTPDSDEEDSAVLDGISGQTLDALGAGEPVYLGVAVSSGGKTAVLPFLNPENEAQLEYDLSRAITEVTATKKVKLGILSSLPVMGGYDTPQIMMMQQRQAPKPPWWIITELKRNFDVVEIPATTDAIAPDIDVVLAIHPGDLGDATLYALDQFVLRGGRLLAFLDPFPLSGMNQPYMKPAGSSLGKLLSRWGIEFTADKLVADRKLGTRMRGGYGTVETMPTVLSLTREEMDSADPAVASLNNLLLFCAGSFSGKPVEGLQQTTLLQTSDDAGVTDTFAAQQPGEMILRNLKTDGKKHALAIKLTGTFPTAFPEGKPGDAAKTADETKKADAASDAKKSEPPKKETGLKKSVKPGFVVLIGDADMLYDPFCVREMNFLGQKVAQPINDNLNFALNMVDQLSGDDNLLEIRARGTASHPFTVVRDLQAEAEKEFQDRIIKLENDLRDVQQQITELQSKRKPGESELLSSEQRELLKEFRQKEVEARKELKQVRKQLRQKIDSLENTLIFVNMALMPLLVILAGIVVAVVRHRRGARR